MTEHPKRRRKSDRHFVDLPTVSLAGAVAVLLIAAGFFGWLGIAGNAVAWPGPTVSAIARHACPLPDNQPDPRPMLDRGKSPT
jgi:hypothetical protein